MTNYLYRLNEENPASDLGPETLVGPLKGGLRTGSISIRTADPTHVAPNRSLEIYHSGVFTGLSSSWVMPLFSSGTIPKRFILDFSISKFNYGSDGELWFIIGTDDGTHPGLNGFGFSPIGNPTNQYLTIASGILSRSTVTPTLTDNNLKVFGHEPNSFKLEFEMRTNTFVDAPNEFTWRATIYANNPVRSTDMSTFKFASRSFNSASVPVHWNGKTFDKIYLAYAEPSTRGSINSILIDYISIKKHYMDWD